MIIFNFSLKYGAAEKGTFIKGVSMKIIRRAASIASVVIMLGIASPDQMAFSADVTPRGVVNRFFSAQSEDLEQLAYAYDLVSEKMRDGKSREEYAFSEARDRAELSPVKIKILNVMEGPDSLSMVMTLCTYQSDTGQVSRKELYYLVESSSGWKINEVETGEWVENAQQATYNY